MSSTRNFGTISQKIQGNISKNHRRKYRKKTPGIPKSAKIVNVISLILTTKFSFICSRKKLQTYRIITPERHLPIICKSKISTLQPRHRKNTRKITRIIMVFIIKCHLSARHPSFFCINYTARTRSISFLYSMQKRLFLGQTKSKGV